MDVDYKETLPILALMDALKTLTAESYITREDAETLFGIGLQTIDGVIRNPNYNNIHINLDGRLLAFRCHRDEWTLWAKPEFVRKSSSNPKKRAVDDIWSAGSPSSPLQWSDIVKIKIIGEKSNGPPSRNR